MITLRVIGVGRTSKGPESELFERYLKRAKVLARSVGIKDVSALALKESTQPNVQMRREQEGAAIIEQILPGSFIVLLDERGENISTEHFAKFLLSNESQSFEHLVFVIGGPDGHGDVLRQKAHKTISFGRATWPHMMVKAMLFEQIYRSMTLLSGHPYHRE